MTFFVIYFYFAICSALGAAIVGRKSASELLVAFIAWPVIATARVFAFLYGD